VVIAAETSPGPEHRIVVGVDGSVPSKAALRWALRQARLTGAVVEAVTAWEFRVVYSYPAPVIGTVNFEELATSVVQDAIAEATPGAEVGRISYKVVEGNALSAAQRVGRRRPAGCRQPRTWRIRVSAARFDRPAVRPPRHVPGRSDPGLRDRPAARVRLRMR
jgi:hypothetical protein